LTVINPDANVREVIPELMLASCAVFKVRRGARTTLASPSVREAPARPVSQNSTA
jgi:hypothetical protein